MKTNCGPVSHLEQVVCVGLNKASQTLVCTQHVDRDPLRSRSLFSFLRRINGAKARCSRCYNHFLKKICFSKQLLNYNKVSIYEIFKQVLL